MSNETPHIADKATLTDDEFRRIYEAAGRSIGAYEKAEIEFIIAERLASEQATLDEYVQEACACGHAAIDHHGIDPADGCLGVASHRLPQCPCRQTCSAVLADVLRYATLTLDSISAERRGMAEDLLSIIDQPDEELS